MPNQEHLAKLKENLFTWLLWRRKNSQIVPDLESAKLTRANLYLANLSGANLSNSDLTNAFLFSADLYDANLASANLSNADLSSVNLTNADLTNANFTNANLTNAYLMNVDLSSAKLTGAKLIGAKLIGADLSGADLSGADLSGVQASKANFESVTLTSACIMDWNINSQTNLQKVKCDYIYLEVIYSLEEKKDIFKNRRPHDPDKIFAPGEFTKLFQKALETVDIIFSEGIEWVAFLESFQQLQAEIKSEELSIQAIEKKSGGAFIVRVEVPPEADKVEIQKYIEREYEAKLKVIEASYQKQLQAKDEELIKAYREKSNDLLEVVKTMASIKQTTNINNNPTMSTGNTYNTEKAGIVHHEGDIKGNAKVAAIINESSNQDLAEAAAEIQKLLDQLSQTNPTENPLEQMTVGVKLAEEIQNNPTRWQKVINVIKAMGIEALAEVVDNPIFNIAKAGIEAAVES